MKAALFVGGWQGHRPVEFADWASDLLRQEGFTVESFDDFTPLLDQNYRNNLDLIVPIWSSARSSHQAEFGSINRKEELALLECVARGCGLAGWHGHMGDAFRDHPCYHFMVGGQFVAHPPGWPDNLVPSDDFVNYRISFTNPRHDITTGLQDFDINGEQYYMLVDPGNQVLASSKFDGRHLPWINGTTMPVCWVKPWGEGRIFYCSLGHTLAELTHPVVELLLRRGFRWAARQRLIDFADLPPTLQQLVRDTVTA